MNTGFRSQCVPTYRYLTHEQIIELHRASLEVLETVGVRVKHPEGLALLRDAGCRILDRDVTLIPNWLVEQSIRSAPCRVSIYDRRGELAMRLEGRNIHFGLGTDLIRTFDLRTGRLRPSRLEDVANAAIVVDALPNIDFSASFALPEDVPTNAMYIECFRTMVANTTKPIFFTAAGPEDLAVIFEMAAAVTGGEQALRQKPFMIHYAETQSPLVHSNSGVSKLFLCADRGLPVNYTQGMLAGASGPVTLAGALAVANAEALSGVVLHQLRRKGSPIVSGLTVVPMDMRTAIFSYGAPEYRITDAAYTDLYHYYGLPCWGTAGCSDSCTLDQQAGYEAAITILMSAQSGANLIHDVGYLGQGLIGNPAAIVMCDEIIGYVKRVLRGFDASRDNIPMDLIRAVGPGGDYLTQEHTLKHHRQEFWVPPMANRKSPDDWAAAGGQSYGEVLAERTLQILDTHKCQPLPADVSRRIDEIAKKAENTLAEKHFAA